MVARLKLGDLVVDVILKDIKNIHLSVYPPAGRVRVSAPKRMKLETIRVFVISKLDWIRRQQQHLRAQERETRRGYVERESHWVWGRRYLLSVRERDSKPTIELTPRRLVLTVRPGTNVAKRQDLLQQWYREQIRSAVPPLLARWEPRIGVKVERFFVRQMKTRWGSCNHKLRTIQLNTELAKKPAECLEYIVVHEMVHLLEPTHNARFVALMDRFLPQWYFRRDQLNQLPAPHAEWGY